MVSIIYCIVVCLNPSAYITCYYLYPSSTDTFTTHYSLQSGAAEEEGASIGSPSTTACREARRLTELTWKVTLLVL